MTTRRSRLRALPAGLASWIGRRIGRAEAAMQAHPLRWSFGLVAVYGFGFFLLLTPTFENNDDVGMMFIADGTFYGTPQPHLVFQHPVVGITLSTLYRWTTALNWYSVWLYSLHGVVLVVVTYLVLVDRRTRLSLRLVGLAGLWAAYPLSMWMNLQFTGVSITLGGAAVLLYATVAARERAPYGAIVLAGLLLGLSGWVRWRGVQAVVVLSVPLAVMAWRRIPWRRHAVFAGAALGLLLFGGIFQSVYYDGDADWHEYLEFNGVRGSIHSTERLREARDPEVLDALGWSRADYEMFRNWFYLDEERYSTETLRTLVDEVGTPPRGLGDVRDLLDGVEPFTRLVVLGGLVAAAWAVSGPVGRITLAATTGWFVVVVTALAVFARLPSRVSLPILAYLGMLYLVRPPPAFPEEYRPAPAWLGWGSAALIVATTTAALAVGIDRTLDDTAVNNRRSDSLFATTRELASLDPEGVFVSWADSIDIDRVSPEAAERIEATIIPLGWHQRSPMHERRLTDLGITDLYEAIALDEHVYLPLSPRETDQEWYLRYMAEHYGIEGFLRPAGAVDVEARLFVYDLVVSGYELDEVEGTLRERRGDGSVVDYPLSEEAAIGAFQIIPNRPERLRGWVVARGLPGPVHHIVLVHDGVTLDVRPTTFLRPNLAQRYGAGPNDRIGFVLDGLDEEVGTEVRVFAVVGEAAYEIPRGAG